MDVDESCSYHGVMEEDWTSGELRFREESRQKARASVAIATYLPILSHCTCLAPTGILTNIFAHHSDAISQG